MFLPVKLFSLRFKMRQPALAPSRISNYQNLRKSTFILPFNFPSLSLFLSLRIYRSIVSLTRVSLLKRISPSLPPLSLFFPSLSHTRARAHTVAQSNLNVTTFRSAATRYHLRLARALARQRKNQRQKARVRSLVHPLSRKRERRRVGKHSDKGNIIIGARRRRRRRLSREGRNAAAVSFEVARAVVVVIAEKNASPIDCLYTAAVRVSMCVCSIAPFV